MPRCLAEISTCVCIGSNFQVPIDYLLDEPLLLGKRRRRRITRIPPLPIGAWSRRHHAAVLDREQAAHSEHDQDRDYPRAPRERCHRGEAECPRADEQDHRQHCRDDLEPSRLPRRGVQEAGEGDQHTEDVRGGRGDRHRRFTKRKRGQEQDGPKSDDDPILPTRPCTHGSYLLGTTSDLWNAVGAPSGGPQSTLWHEVARNLARTCALGNGLLAHPTDLLLELATSTCARIQVFLEEACWVRAGRASRLLWGGPRRRAPFDS